MTLPNRWTLTQLQADAAEARRIFRRERLQEPLELYSRHFETFAGHFRRTVDRLESLSTDPVDADLVASLMDGRDQQKAFRYLTAPPISADDLKTLAEVASLAPSRLRRDPEGAGRVRDTVMLILDRHRFPWAMEGRSPTSEERERAVLASATLAAAKEVETARRSTSRKDQEYAVKATLQSIGFKEVPRRAIPMITAAPNPSDTKGRHD